MRLPLAVALDVLAVPAAAQDGLAERLTAPGAGPCPESAPTCLTRAVPPDHAANDPDDMIDIPFAVSLAPGPSDGVMFSAGGGPGGSGLPVAEACVASLDPEMQARIDLVFIGQRGVGPENGIDRPQALSAFFVADLPLDQPDIALSNAKQAVTDCLAQIAASMPGGGLGLDVAVTGRHRGRLIFRDNSRTAAVAPGGVWNGRAITIPRLLP